ncbi:ribonuclease J [Mycoplasmopsis verecunda]|uniref:Ribonuclease J n=1 Tax=Mycoplasmopsis verecunda TaxID=171291 RepID=A0A1T4KV15_9BACT|nr:ribonuclease J [Mycoplasmopsis verecunda]WPB54633.1 ribonuclease J [Mycoplasmopsis verecunda]SJZ46282.1 ribonuclease J [Mycoplasmopsis verecunda]
MDNVNIFALGGQDENGKNCYVFEHNNDIYVINAGVKVPIDANNGVDTLIPNFDYLIKHKDKIKGIFITDIKNESFSALPWLLMKIPNLTIYTSAFNKVMVLERISKYGIDQKSFKVVTLRGKTKIGSVEITPFNLTGSMPGNTGFNFSTKAGDYIFMFNYVEGDLGIYGKTFFNALANYFSKNKIIGLISDAGRSYTNGRAIDKYKANPKLEEAFKKTHNNKRIIIGAYGEEMVSLQQVIDLAIKHKRPIIPYGKTYADLLYLISKFGDKLQLPEVVDYKMLSKYDDPVILITAATERLYNRFDRIANGKDVYLKLNSDDTIVMMAPPVNGLESQYAEVMDMIAKIAPNLHEILDSEYFYIRPTKDDLLNLIKALKPSYFIPTQGLYRYLVGSSEFIVEELNKKQKVDPIILLNGKIAHFQDDKLFSHNGKIKEVGSTIIDGFGVGDISPEVIAEREALGREGVIVINGLYSPKTKKIIGQLHINYIGVIDESEIEETNGLIKDLIVDVLKTKSFTTMREVNEKLRKTIRKKIFKLKDKDPMVALTLTTI